MSDKQRKDDDFLYDILIKEAIDKVIENGEEVREGTIAKYLIDNSGKKMTNDYLEDVMDWYNIKGNKAKFQKYAEEQLALSEKSEK